MDKLKRTIMATVILMLLLKPVLQQQEKRKGKTNIQLYVTNYLKHMIPM